MKIIRIDECFLQFNILGLTLDIPLSGAEQRYHKFWFFGIVKIPFTSKLLFYYFYKNFKFSCNIFNTRRKSKNEENKAE